MQRAVTPQRPSENDCFADNAIEYAEEIDTLLSSASIYGRPFCNLHLTDDVDLLGGTEEELRQLTERLEKRAAGYGMEISSNKSKTIIHSIEIDHLATYG